MNHHIEINDRIKKWLEYHGYCYRDASEEVVKRKILDALASGDLPAERYIQLLDSPTNKSTNNDGRLSFSDIINS